MGPVVAGAQTETLTLDLAIARGLAGSHRVAEAGARQEAAEAVEDQRRAAALPLASLQTGYTRTNHVVPFGIPGELLIYPDVPDNYRWRIDLQWSIYNGGRTSALTRAAAADADAAAQDRETARVDMKLEITRAYWAVVTARAAVDVVGEALARMVAHRTDVNNQFNVGLVPPSDVTTVEAQHARQEVLLIEARNLAETTAAEFRRLVGLAPETPFELEERIDAPSEPPPDVAFFVETARANRTDRKALTSRVDALGERVVAARAGRLPEIVTIAGYDLANPNPRIFPRQEAWKPSFDVSVNLTWALFDGGRVRAEMAEAAANQQAAAERLKEFDDGIDLEVRQRASDLVSAQAAISATDVGVLSAAEARRVIANRFAAGVATNTEVIDAQLVLLQAELDRTRALANAHLAVARLVRALGR